jgi:LysM repeat protein
MQHLQQKKTKNSIFVDILEFIYSFASYVVLRIRQIVIYFWAFTIFVYLNISNVKQGVVKRMFWGRSVFYRSAFQFSVGLLTLLLGVWELTGRLNLFMPKVTEVLAFPSERLGDADYLYEGGSIQSIVSDFSLSREFDVQKYIVQKGDTIQSIAEKFEVSTDTIRWANGITGDFLKIGQELDILPINGVIHTVKSGDTIDVIARKYDASVQDIYDINWLDSTNLKIGQEILVPNGRMPQPKPVVKPIVASTKPYSPPSGPIPSTGSFIRPVNCGKVTNPFSNWHGGVDIAQAGGCEVHAVDGGVVIMARWGGNGGLQIMIDHGNGWISLYAHNASLYVKEGTIVTKGQPISYMGASGHASGVHLHFGLQYKGGWVNPQAYVPI